MEVLLEVLGCLCHLEELLAVLVLEDYLGVRWELYSIITP
jgi:hypothetical protein